MKAKLIFKGGPGSGHHGHQGLPGKHGGSAPGSGGGGSGMSAGKGALRTHEVKMPAGAVTSADGLSKSFRAKLIKGKNAGKALVKRYRSGSKAFTDASVKGSVVRLQKGDFAGAFVRLHGVVQEGMGSSTTYKFEGSIINGTGRESWADDLIKFDPDLFNG